MRMLGLMALSLAACLQAACADDAVALCDGSEAAELSYSVAWGNIATTAHFLYAPPALVINGHCDYWASWGDAQKSLQELRLGHLDDVTRHRIALSLRVAELGEIGSDAPAADRGGEVLAGRAGVVGCSGSCEGTPRGEVMNNARALLEELWQAGEPSTDRLSAAAYLANSVWLGGEGSATEWPANSDIEAIADAAQGRASQDGVEIDDPDTRSALRALRGQLGTSYFEVTANSEKYSVMVRDDLPETLLGSALQLSQPR